MDVQRLMCDLTVDQLENIQSSLRFVCYLPFFVSKKRKFSREIETKKEELRQMVGRRYRVVLQAATAVNRLSELSQLLVRNLQAIKPTAGGELEEARKTTSDATAAQRAFARRFILLNSVMPLVSVVDSQMEKFVVSAKAENAGSKLCRVLSGFEGASSRVSSRCAFKRPEKAMFHVSL